VIGTTATQRSESETARSPSTQISLLTTRKEVDALVPEWTQLFYSSAVPNPFAHPIWLLTWFDHYARDAQLYFVTIRDEGHLVAVAPFYLERHSVLPGLPAITRARLLGVGAERHITEMPQILTASQPARRNLRRIVAFLAERSHDWDWLELTVTPEQGIFEPDWVMDPPFDGYVLPSTTRVAVILPLTASWDDLRAGLKRNVKESIRRGFNRLSRDGHQWEFLEGARDLAELQEQLMQLVALSRARSVAEESVRDTPVTSTTDANLMFLQDAARRLFGNGLLDPCFLRIDGAKVAGRLVLRANKSIFFSFSGFDPKWWDYGISTTLMAEILRTSIEHGDGIANLSIDPNIAKLRWSERLVFYNDVILVGTRRRSRLAFSLWWQRRALLGLQGAARWARFRVKYAAIERDGRGMRGAINDP
jgi:CelD/BcsL family acetyltransferase involved in cellulose biosynthesis